MAMTERRPAAKMVAPERRKPRTVWLTDSEFHRVNRLRLVKDDPALARKALMLGVSIIENGVGGEASVAGVR